MKTDYSAKIYINMTLKEKKTNPYQLVWYRADWSDAKVKKNNTKYWEWEMKYNNFVPSNSRKNKA